MAPFYTILRTQFFHLISSGDKEQKYCHTYISHCSFEDANALSHSKAQKNRQ